MRSRSSFLNIIFDHLQKELCLFDFCLTMYNSLKSYFFSSYKYAFTLFTFKKKKISKPQKISYTHFIISLGYIVQYYTKCNIIDV